MTLYTINSARSRFQIIRDYAARHNLTTEQVDELVRQLPDYGVRTMLFASLVVLAREDKVVSLAHHRDLLRANKVAVGGWNPGSVA
jgi:hypothetical protein